MKRRDFLIGGTLAPFVPVGRARAEDETPAATPPSDAASAPATAASAPAEAASAPASAASAPAEAASAPVNAEPLFADVDKQIKFKVEELAEHLRSKKHEDWRLVAYTDPAHKPEAPIYDIGAGFNMSIPTDKKRGEEGDLYKFHSIRLEPSSRSLWRAAGLSEEKFDATVARVQERIKLFGHDYRKNFPQFKALNEDPAHHDISEAEAENLLKISIRHAAHNAMAYAKDFPSMTKYQQMGMTAIVYQIGSNLEQFEKTLTAMNNNDKLDRLKASGAPAKEIAREEKTHWQNVAKLFSQSDWARKHKARAARVLAWLDPEYGQEKSLAATARSWLDKATNRKPQERTR